MDGSKSLDPDFRLIAESAYGWESWLPADGGAAWINSAVERMTGWSRADCLAMADYPVPVVDSRDRETFQCILDSARDGGFGNDQPIRICRADGSLAWVAVSWRGVKAADGILLGVRLSIRDLTDSIVGWHQAHFHDALAELARSGVLSSGSLENAFRAITETAARVLDVGRVGIWLLDQDRSRIECRDLYELASGTHHSGAKVERARFPVYFAALDQDRVVAANDAQRDPRTIELTDDYLVPLGVGAMLDAPIIRGGRTVGVLCHEQLGQTRYWISGEIDFASSLADMVAIALEASERREMEALHQRLASILEASPDFVGTMDSEGNPTYINPAGRALLGLAPGDPMDSWSVAKQYTPEAKEQRDRVALPTALDRGVWSGESAFLPLNGESIPVAQVLIAHKDGDGNLQYLSSVARDLRPWKEAQAVLQERERFLATLVANLPGVAYRRRKAPGWPMEYISEGCLELTGYSAEALMAARPYFNDIVHAEDRGRVYREVDAALAEGRYFKVEYRICRADGSELWVWSKGRGIYDESGQLIAREGFIGDINDRVRAQLQLERLNAELEARVEERTAKLAEANQHLEAFAYSVSHDLKAPLRGIHGYSRLLLEDYRDLLPDEGRRFVDNIVTASERMNQLIEDLLTYSKLERRELSKSRIALASVIDRVMAEREIELHHLGADVTAEVGDLAVSADADALIQAVRNLVDNALKFSSAARPPRVAIKASAAGGKVALSVSDNGCGFDMKYHQRIFDIFQRLHRIEEYPGTGVGLAIVRKAIERMGGRVWAESEPGAGATFFMELPA